jgi:hypothetical protein
MMGRLEQDQRQRFYSFCLEEVVPDVRSRTPPTSASRPW